MKVKVKLCKLLGSDKVEVISEDILENCILTKKFVDIPLCYIEKIRNKKIKPLYFLGVDDKTKGQHITLNFFQQQKLLWMYGKHWFQSKDNIMWIINVIVALLAVVVAYLAIIHI